MFSVIGGLALRGPKIKKITIAEADLKAPELKDIKF